MFKQKQITVNAQLNWNAVLYGTLLALLASLGILLATGVVVYYAKVGDIWLPMVSSGVYFAGVFAGGVYASRKAGQKGLVHGIIVGVAFVILSSFLTWLFPAELNWMIFFKKVLYGIIGGAIGGILGVK